jgi:hypothetical protein
MTNRPKHRTSRLALAAVLWSSSIAALRTAAAWAGPDKANHCITGTGV